MNTNIFYYQYYSHTFIMVVLLLWFLYFSFYLFNHLNIPIFMVEKAMAPHSSTLAWKIPWMEEPGRLRSVGSLRVGHDWATSLSLFTFMHWRRKWQPTPVFLPGESQGWGILVDCRLSPDCFFMISRWGLLTSTTHFLFLQIVVHGGSFHIVIFYWKLIFNWTWVFNENSYDQSDFSSASACVLIVT